MSVKFHDILRNLRKLCSLKWQCRRFLVCFLNIETNIFVSMKILKQRFSTVNNYTTSIHKLVFVIFRRGWLGCKWITTFKFFLRILETFLKTDLWFVLHRIKQLIFSFRCSTNNLMLDKRFYYLYLSSSD